MINPISSKSHNLSQVIAYQHNVKLPIYFDELHAHIFSFFPLENRLSIVLVNHYWSKIAIQQTISQSSEKMYEYVIKIFNFFNNCSTFRDAEDIETLTAVNKIKLIPPHICLKDFKFFADAQNKKLIEMLGRLSEEKYLLISNHFNGYKEPFFFKNIFVFCDLEHSYQLSLREEDFDSQVKKIDQCIRTFFEYCLFDKGVEIAMNYKIIGTHSIGYFCKILAKIQKFDLIEKLLSIDFCYLYSDVNLPGIKQNRLNRIRFECANEAANQNELDRALRLAEKISREYDRDKIFQKVAIKKAEKGDFKNATSIAKLMNPIDIHAYETFLYIKDVKKHNKKNKK